MAHLVLFSWLALASALPGSAAQADAASALSCEQPLAAALPADTATALGRIPDTSRRLLALRGYLRAHDLPLRWSWSEQRIRDYPATPEYQQAMAALAQVQSRFAHDNPGYVLFVNTQVRSLDVQLERWNQNASVASAASGLAAAAATACTAEPSSFASWLRAWQPAVQSNLAVPGLSPHGQGRAYDFQVQAGAEIIAGTDSSRIEQDWRAGGWADKLALAIKQAGPAFKGPLSVPDEPWHYAYVPVSQ